MNEQLGQIPILVEDLGMITEEVESLRDTFSYPGMKILQIAFRTSGNRESFNPNSKYLPHNYTNNSVVYTGTHDNSTIKGFIDNCSENEISHIRQYFSYNGDELVWCFIRAALSSISDYAIFPMQDLLGLDNESKMNTPSTFGGNWTWRYRLGSDNRALAKKMYDLTYYYGRVNNDNKINQKS